MSEDYGALAAALAKAQAAFPTISRDKEVTVKIKTGGQYTFKYAPLDTILAAVRGPLSANGLAIVQLLDDDTLVTSLLHESGAIMSGRTPIPAAEGIQAYGSAITYLRRYSIQALLGIAAEEDDDGNTAAGNHATFGGNRKSSEAPPSTEPVLVGPWDGTGKVIVRKSGPADGNIRQGPDGPYVIVAFSTVDDQTIPQVMASGALALDLIDAAGAELNGMVATIAGDLYRIPWDKDGKPMPPYQRLHLTHIKTRAWSLPVPGQSGPGLFDPADEAELDAAVPV